MLLLHLILNFEQYIREFNPFGISEYVENKTTIPVGQVKQLLERFKEHLRKFGLKDCESLISDLEKYELAENQEGAQFFSRSVILIVTGSYL